MDRLQQQFVRGLIEQQGSEDLRRTALSMPHNRSNGADSRYKEAEDKVWGECVAEFRTFLLEKPDLTGLDLVTG